MTTIAEIRQKYPQYADMSDTDLATALHRKHYADMPFEDFSQRIGLIQQAQQPTAAPRQPADMGAAGIAKGVGDVALSSALNLVHQPASTLQGLTGGVRGAISPNSTFREGYAAAKDQYNAAVESGETIVPSDQLRTPEGEAVAGRLQQLVEHPLSQAVSRIDERVNPLRRAINTVRGLGPEAADVVDSAVSLATLRSPAALRAPGPPRRALTAEDVVARAARGDSAGAAAAATNVADASPELRQAIVRAGRGGRSVNAEALERHLEAESLPVPIRLTAGEATLDPVTLSTERNLRGKHTQMADRMRETNEKLGQNLQALRDRIGPEVFSTNPVEHGDTLIAAYRKVDQRAENAVNRAYHNLRQAAGGDVPVDARAVLADATARMHKKLLFDHAPPEIMRTLSRLAESDSMTFENFESMRTNLARIARSNADGNVKAAAGEIRAALESLPLRAGAEHLKGLADTARAIAKRRFDAMDADPAYSAAVNGTVDPDRFVRRFVLGAGRDDVDLMVKTLSDEPSVRQTVSVAVLDHLRDAARLDRNYSGNFSAPGFQRALDGLQAKANIIFDPRTAETLGKLSNVARYTTYQPRGSFVNNSNTMVASAAKHGADALEGMTNYAFMGLPVGTLARRGFDAAGTRRVINRSLRPGAGIDSPAVRRMIETERARRGENP